MNTQKPLHFVVVPLMAQGHMLPAIDIARLLAEHGAIVSLITTPVNATRNVAAMNHFNSLSLPVRFVQLDFPCSEFGLPELCENIDLIPSIDLFLNFFNATFKLKDQLHSYMINHEVQPSCMICDMCLPWTAVIARELALPRFIFHGQSCFSLLTVHNIRKHGLYDTSSDDEPFAIPDLPQRIEIMKARAPVFFPVPGWEKLRDEAVHAEATANGVVLNSFNDLEGWYIDRLREEMGMRVWAIGPVAWSNRDEGSKARRGTKEAGLDETKWLSWLDGMDHELVLYVSFGSLSINSLPQLIEIGKGLEASGCPFIWVIKEKEMTKELEEWMLVEGFEERNKGRCLIIKGWAPQTAILSHRAIGGFMTHCGWNSVLESVSVGVSMVTWPRFADQHLNEKLIVEVLRIGVGVEVKGQDRHVEELKSDQLEKAVRKLMDGGEESEERRKRAREFGDKARKAMGEGGSSYEAVTRMINYVREQ